MRTCRSEYFLDPFLRKEDTLLPSNPSPFRAVSTYAICPWTKQESTTTYTCQNPFLALVSAFYFNQDSCQSWWWFLGRTDRGSMVLSCNCFVSFGLRIERKVTLWRRGKLTLQNLRPINNLASNFQDHGCSQCQGKSGSLNVSSIWLVESLEKGVLLLFNESVICAVNHLTPECSVDNNNRVEGVCVFVRMSVRMSDFIGKARNQRHKTTNDFFFSKILLLLALLKGPSVRAISPPKSFFSPSSWYPKTAVTRCVEMLRKNGTLRKIDAVLRFCRVVCSSRSAFVVHW